MYLLNVDLLEFVGRTEIHLNNLFTNGIYKFSNGLILKKIKNNGKLRHFYEHLFEISYKNNKIGFLHTKTLALSFSNGFNTLVRINNNIFYTEDIGFVNKLIVEALELTKTKISRLDIAYDTDIDVLTKFKKFYNDTSMHFRYVDKINVGASGNLDKQIPIGSLKSGVKSILIYNKTKELIKSHKEYIRNTHNKVFDKNIIYRVELRIYSKTLEIEEIDIYKLEDKTYLEMLFNTYYTDLITFTDKESNNIIEYIHLNNTSQKLQRAVKNKIKCGGKQVKTVINFLDKEVRTSGFTGLIKFWGLIRTALLKKYGLESWYSVRN